MKDVRKTPYSYTSKEPEASEAAKGSDIYIIEVHVDKGVRTYALGYKYRAYEKFSLTGGSRWKDEFKFKNSATLGVPADGIYFDIPVIIHDTAFHKWLTEKPPGMAEIPAYLVIVLERLIAEPTNGARRFA